MASRWMSSTVVVAAVVAAVAVRAEGGAFLRSPAGPPLEQGVSTEPRLDAFYIGMLDGLPPQEKVERALEWAIGLRAGAAEYVIGHAADWRGAFEPGERLRQLANLAADSPRIEVRMAAFEVQLAGYGFEKSDAEVDRLLQMRARDPQGASAWVWWNLGLLGARGVARERILRELSAALDSGDAASRRWAVEAVAKFGGVESLPLLLGVAAREPSAWVRERAFCALAQSGTLQLAKRYEAVPGLFAIAADTGMEARTVTWAYQALREITAVDDLPDDAVQWRSRLSEAGLL